MFFLKNLMRDMCFVKTARYAVITVNLQLLVVSIACEMSTQEPKSFDLRARKLQEHSMGSMQAF